MELVQLDPNEILWPENRVTAYYEEGQEEMLKENLAAMGQLTPITVVKVGDQYWGTDGLHRTLAAIERGDATVPCVVREGEAKDAYFANLVQNVLHGKTKASEQVAVMGEMFESMGVTIEELVKRTGHSRDWVEKHLTVAKATEVVRGFLDQQLITLGHAYALARIEDVEIQERICYQLLLYRWSVKDLEGHIKETLKVGAAPPPPAAPVEPVEPRRQECGYCHQQTEPTKIAMVAVCVSCSGYLVDFHRAAAKEG